MRLEIDNAMLAILIEHAKDDALSAGATVHSVDDLVKHLDENPDGCRKIAIELEEEE